MQEIRQISTVTDTTSLHEKELKFERTGFQITSQLEVEVRCTVDRVPPMREHIFSVSPFFNFYISQIANEKEKNKKISQSWF